jgi:DNA (cytosine-5)-methyltransferase 1
MNVEMDILDSDLTAVSLFSGIGGFDLALSNAGVKVCASVEIDNKCRDVLAKHFPETQLFSDIKDVTGEQLRATGFIPERGIITAGFPCQDLSIAGLRKGLDGSRSGLFWEIIRLVDETQPRYLIIENVAGLLSSQSGRDLGIVIEALVQRRYGIAWRVLDSQYFGVPQRRRRIFIVASLTDHRSPVEILFEPESRTGHLEPSTKKKQKTTRLFTPGTRSNNKPISTELFDATRNADVRFYDQSPTMKARWGTGGNNVPMLINDKDQTNTICASIYHHGSFNNQDVQAGHLVKVTPTEHGDVLMRMREGKDGGGKGPLISDDKSLTIATSNDQTLYTKGAVRRLTPTECERLQAFPDDWTAGQSDSARYKQLGNAVTVSVVAWIVNRMVSINSKRVTEAL